MIYFALQIYGEAKLSAKSRCYECTEMFQYFHPFVVGLVTYFENY